MRGRYKIYTAEESILRKRESQRRYKLSDKGKITQSKYYRSDACKKAAKSWRERNPIKIKAHRITNTAISKGILQRCVCSVCGNNESFAHHEDYTKPLEVRWLCNYHHSHLHRGTLVEEGGKK